MWFSWIFLRFLVIGCSAWQGSSSMVRRVADCVRFSALLLVIAIVTFLNSLCTKIFANSFVVTQIGEQVFAGNTTFDDFRIHGDALFFVASGSNGTEVFKTDGNEVAEIDILPGPSSSYPSLNLFTGLDDFLLIRARSQIGQEIFSVDNTGLLVSYDLVPGSNGSSIGNWGRVDNHVLLAIEGPTESILYKIDGHDLTTLETYPRVSDEIIQVGRGVGFANTLVFEAVNASGYHLYRTDGNELKQLIEIDPLAGITSGSIGFAEVNGRLIFRSGPIGHELYYQTDGEVITHIPKANGVLVSSPGRTKNIGTKLFFSGVGANGIELFATDGETTIEYDLNPGELGSNAGSLAGFYELGDEIVTRAVGIYGDEVFVTKGDLFVQFDINPGPSGSFAERFKSTSEKVYFSAISANGRELFATDGTSLIEFDLNPGSGDSSPLVDLGATIDGRLALSAIGANGRELFVTEGTTFREFDINPGPASSSPSNFVEFAEQVFFTATGPSGRGVFVTDGYSIEQITTLNPMSGGAWFGTSFARFGDSLYFLADTTSGVHLFKISTIPEPSAIAIICSSIFVLCGRREHT